MSRYPWSAPVLGIKKDLFGYSQIFTPHSSPKRIRALIDYRYVAHPNKLQSDLSLLLFSGLLLIKGLLRACVRPLVDLARRVGSGREDAEERIPGGLRQRRTSVLFEAVNEKESSARGRLHQIHVSASMSCRSS